MFDEIKIDPELEGAAHLLQERLRKDATVRWCAENGTAPWKVSPGEWDCLSTHAKNGVPPWLPSLLNRFDFCAVEFELPYSDPESGLDTCLLEFFDPRCYEEEVVSWIADMPSFGFYAFAGASNGDLWVATAANGAAGDIYLLESSGWDGSQPTSGNGLIHASKSLASLFPTLSVSNVHPQNPRRLL